MEKSIITFSANEQNLQKTGGIGCYASDTVSYIEAHFALGENWSGYDSIRAVWFNDYKTISTVLDFNGVCIVPHEVLTSRGKVMVNLVGSVLVSDELSDRLTTFPCEALKVSAKAKISGSETAAVTPSQFEQFVEAVKDNADRAEAGAGEAKDEADRAESEAESALASAQASEASALRASGHAQNAQSAETSARAYAQSAQNYATNAESAKDDAIDARDEIRSMRANAETLEPNQSATASYSNGVLTLGIPKGQKGDTGDTGASAGFGTVSASVDDSTGTPSVEVTTSGTDTAKNFAFAFHNLKGAKGDKGDDGTVPDLDLILPTDTASGDIVSITDGQNIVPVKSLKVTLEPIQDLNGYDKPWTGGAGKNKFDKDSLDSVSDYVEYYNSYYYSAPIILKPNTTYVMSPTSTVSLGVSDYYVLYINHDASDPNYIGGGGEVFRYPVNAGTPVQVEFTTGATGIIRFGVIAGNPATSPKATALEAFMTINYQVEEGTTATTWTPYSNICPIDGWTEVNTQRTGVNVWDEEWEVGSINARGESSVSNNNIRSKYFNILPNTTYYFYSGTDIAREIFYYKSDGSFISYRKLNTNGTFTTPADCNIARFVMYNAYGATYKNDISINYPSTDTEYHAYQGTTYTTDLGRTVYGGTLDVVSGELVVDRAIYQPTSVRSIEQHSSGVWFCIVTNVLQANVNGSLLSDMFVDGNLLEGAGTCYLTGGGSYLVAILPQEITTKAEADVWFASNQPTFVYELATPQTYQLDPQTISLLHGNNNVWSDGSVELTYNADVGLYIDKKLGTSGTRTLSMTRTLAKSETDDTKSDNIQLAED